jgi:hypothetical protein
LPAVLAQLGMSLEEFPRVSVIFFVVERERHACAACAGKKTLLKTTTNPPLVFT